MRVRGAKSAAIDGERVRALLLSAGMRMQKPQARPPRNAAKMIHVRGSIRHPRKSNWTKPGDMTSTGR